MRAHVACVLLTLAGCGEVSNGVTDAATTDTPSTEIDARVIDAAPAIDAPPVQHWTKIATVTTPLDLGNNRGFMAVGLGSRIYIAPIYDDQRPQFHWFDTATLTLSGALTVPPGLQSDFQASGYGAIFVADADSLVLIGDSAVRYNPGTDAWSAIAGYQNGPFHRGESNGAWESSTNTVFMVGGRDDATNSATATALRRNSTGVWANEPGMLPYTVSNGLAYVIPGESRLYVAGGRAGDNNRMHLAVHTTGTSVWTALANSPGDLGQPIGMGHFTANGTTRVFVANLNGRMHFYNPGTSTWDRSINLPTTELAQVVMVAGTPYAVVRAANLTDADIYKLVSID